MIITDKQKEKMEIKPTYVTFEQAKQLSNLGLDSKLFQEQYLIATEELSTNPSLDYINGFTIAAPEQWQVVEWLRVNHGIWVYVDTIEYGKWCFYYKKLEPNKKYPALNVNGEFGLEDFNSPQEAYSAAFDYVLSNNLI